MPAVLLVTALNTHVIYADHVLLPARFQCLLLGPLLALNLHQLLLYPILIPQVFIAAAVAVGRRAAVRGSRLVLVDVHRDLSRIEVGVGLLDEGVQV